MFTKNRGHGWNGNLIGRKTDSEKKGTQSQSEPDYSSGSDDNYEPDMAAKQDEEDGEDIEEEIAQHEDSEEDDLSSAPASRKRKRGASTISNTNHTPSSRSARNRRAPLTTLQPNNFASSNGGTVTHATSTQTSTPATSTSLPIPTLQVPNVRNRTPEEYKMDRQKEIYQQIFSGNRTYTVTNADGNRKTHNRPLVGPTAYEVCEWYRMGPYHDESVLGVEVRNRDLDELLDWRDNKIGYQRKQTALRQMYGKGKYTGDVEKCTENWQPHWKRWNDFRTKQIKQEKAQVTPDSDDDDDLAPPPARKKTKTGKTSKSRPAWVDRPTFRSSGHGEEGVNSFDPPDTRVQGDIFYGYVSDTPNRGTPKNSPHGELLPGVDPSTNREDANDVPHFDDHMAVIYDAGDNTIYEAGQTFDDPSSAGIQGARPPTPPTFSEYEQSSHNYVIPDQDQVARPRSEYEVFLDFARRRYDMQPGGRNANGNLDLSLFTHEEIYGWPRGDPRSTNAGEDLLQLYTNGTDDDSDMQYVGSESTPRDYVQQGSDEAPRQPGKVATGDDMTGLDSGWGLGGPSRNSKE